jgi:hypothetical protein
MPIFIAFAAFVLVVYAHRQGVRLPSWLRQGSFGATKRSGGQKSGVRTAFLEMVLDHDSGAMEGTCLKGRFATRKLSALGRDDLLLLLAELNSADAQGELLLEAYLDRRWPDWRDAWTTRKAKENSRSSARSGVDLSEAYDVLGLKPGATRDEISAAHRRLMMKMHPDHGGSAYLASRINQARDALLLNR